MVSFDSKRKKHSSTLVMFATRCMGTPTDEILQEKAASALWNLSTVSAFSSRKEHELQTLECTNRQHLVELCKTHKFLAIFLLIR